jgi:hypothetical protein
MDVLKNPTPIVTEVTLPQPGCSVRATISKELVLRSISKPVIGFRPSKLKIASG